MLLPLNISFQLPNHEIDPKEIDEKLKRLIDEGKIQTDYLKQIMKNQNKASEYLKTVNLKPAWFGPRYNIMLDAYWLSSIALLSIIYLSKYHDWIVWKHLYNKHPLWNQAKYRYIDTV